MKNKKLLLVMLCLILAISAVGLSGCGEENPVPDDIDRIDEEATQDYTVQLFFANEEYIETGNESLEKLLPAYERTITAIPDHVYYDALQALKVTPEDGYATLITDAVKFNDVYLEGNTVYVDLDGVDLSGGSLGETFLISQIVDTLIKSFDEVEQVQFLVDGEVVESLMGHYDAAKPFTKNLF